MLNNLIYRFSISTVDIYERMYMPNTILSNICYDTADSALSFVADPLLLLSSMPGAMVAVSTN